MNYFFFFFQAEDGIRDWSVTGVQTCALPISAIPMCSGSTRRPRACRSRRSSRTRIGRASCRERGVDLGGRRIIKKKKTKKQKTKRRKKKKNKKKERKKNKKKEK